MRQAQRRWWSRSPAPPAYDAPRPEPLDVGYVSVTHTIAIAATRERVHRWNNDPDRGLEDVLDGGGGVPKVVGTRNLHGDWDPGGDRTGHRRRVEFDSGHFLAEEVLIDTPEIFRYMIWGFTDYRKFVIRQGLAQFQFVAEGNTTRLIWTYSFAPTSKVLRPFVSDFLTGPMSTMMRGTLRVMRDGVESTNAAPGSANTLGA